MNGMTRLTAVCLGLFGFALGGAAKAGTIYQSGGALGTTEAADFAAGSGFTGAFSNTVGPAPPFTTSEIVVNRTSNTLELQLYTGFTGKYYTSGYTVFGTTAKAADIAISLGDSTGFNYGISLGKQGKAAGYYQVTSWNTAYQVWNGRSGFSYGGGWALCGGSVTCDSTTTAATGTTALPTPGAANNPNNYYSSDVSIASGIELASATVTDLGTYLDVVIPNFTWTGDMSLFWATADCGNNPIYGVDLGAGGSQGSIGSIPEPASIALLVTGLVGLRAIRHRV